MADQKKARKQPKKKVLKQDYLKNAGAYYLQRYASSEENFKQVLWRKAHRRQWPDDLTEDQVRQWINDTCETFVRLGVLNDSQYVETKLRSLRRSGRSSSYVRNYLRSKGVEPSLIEDALAGEEEDDADWRAAVAFARRRRLGPFRLSDAPLSRDDERRQLAAFARAGHRYDLARHILATKEKDELL